MLIRQKFASKLKARPTRLCVGKQGPMGVQSLVLLLLLSQCAVQALAKQQDWPTIHLRTRTIHTEREALR